jgi:predicted site-specific integrase-resolvase
MKGSKNEKRGLESVCHFFLSAPQPSVNKKKVTIEVAARTLGVSKGTVINYLNRGLLTRIKENGRVFIELDEVKSLDDPERKRSALPRPRLEAKNQELKGLKTELDTLKQTLEDHSSELAEVKNRIEQLEKDHKGHHQIKNHIV